MKRISINPRIRFGKPCIKGTRIAVVDILNLVSAGYSVHEIPGQLPRLTRKDVLAALAFASRLSEEPTKIFARSSASR